MKPIFDLKGHVAPYEAIESSMDDVEKYFVKAFPNSLNRAWLFDNYLRYTYRFQDEVFPWFEQWINGSFISEKLNPKDIDLVTFLDYRVFEEREEKLMDKFWCFSIEDQHIDAYLVKEYPPDHPNYPIFKSEKSLWKERYGSDRSNLPKGFLRIVFSK